MGELDTSDKRLLILRLTFTIEPTTLWSAVAGRRFKTWLVGTIWLKFWVFQKIELSRILNEIKFVKFF